MKKLISALAIGCTAVIALSAAACGGGSDNREQNTVEELVAKYGYQWTDTSKPILNEEGAKKISFNVYSSKNNSADDYNDMEIMQTLYDLTNVNVSWENVSEASYGDQKTLKFSKPDGIDAIYHAGLTPAEISQYADRGRILAISDYLQYMPNFSKILEDRPDIKRQITNVDDGKIYTLPRVEEMGLKQYPNLLFLNKAWTEKAIDAGKLAGVTKADVKDGLQLTAEQMEELLTYFKETDMNGNGNNADERPMNFVSQNWQGNQCDLFGMFGINDNPDHRVVKDGKVTYTYFEENYKDAVQFIYQWVNKGLIDKVSFEQSQDNFLANGKSGKNAETQDQINKGETYGAFYWWESKTVVSDPDHYVCCAPLKGPKSFNGKDYSMYQTVSIANTPEIDAGELVFFSKVPNIEVLLTYFDRYYMPDISAQINYGPVGIAFEEEKENGKLVPKKETGGKTADEIRLKNAPLGICYLTENEWQNTVQMEERAQLRLDRLKLYVHPYVTEAKLGHKVEPIPNLQFTIAEQDKIARYSAAIETQMANLTKFLYQGVTDTQWNDYINTLKGAGVGVEEVLKVYQAAYDRVANGN